MKIAILGAGVSGLSLGRMLTGKGINVEIYEEENHIGGLCSTETVDGYAFDCYRIPTSVVTYQST